MFKINYKVIQALFASLIYANFSFASELHLYGLGHVSADGINDGQNSSLYVASNSSRLGFNGAYQLDDNLQVIFQYETGVDLTAQGGNDGNGGAESSGQIFTKGRPSYVGLKGNLGKILIGHMPALDQWANDYNLFADQVGDLGNLWEASGVPGRLDNVIYYQSPNIAGSSIAVTYKPEEGQENSDKLIIKGDFHWSKLKIGLAYAGINQHTAQASTHQALALTLGYEGQGFTLGGGVQRESDLPGIVLTDRDSYYLGGSIAVGKKGTIKTQIAISSADDNNDVTQYAIGYDYMMNKNLILYVAYAQTENDDNVNFSVNGKGHGDKIVPDFGNDPSVLSVGIIAKFDLMFGL